MNEIFANTLKNTIFDKQILQNDKQILQNDKKMIQNNKKTIQNNKKAIQNDKQGNVKPMKNVCNTENLYIIDFLNIFSDFREIKYKMENIDFHSVKHDNKEKDTYDFFKLFFTKYIDYANINKNGIFYFIMKKLNNYELILSNIIQIHNDFDIKFIIIEDKYDNVILDKNKDDFLCQYFFCLLSQNNNCRLISNDKYRDKQSYIKLFNFDIYVRILDYNKEEKILEKTISKIKIINHITNIMIDQRYIRCTIPKQNLNKIL